MFSIGDTIVYGNQGVFCIEAVTSQNIAGTVSDYFMLRSSFDNRTTIYVPCNNEKLLSRMRKILTQNEINVLIDSLPEEDDIWIENESQRKEEYKVIVSSGDRLKMLKLIRTLHNHRLNCQKNGKKMHQSDERLFKEAERLLYDEFALVLGIDKKDVVPYIVERLSK